MFPLLPDYAELHCRSNFSFLCGASHPKELVERAHALGYRSLAITDECSLAGVVRAHVEAKKVGLHLIIGTEIRLECGLRMILLATNRNGYGNLSEFITLGRRRAEKGSYRLHQSDLEQPDLAHLAKLPDCLAIFLPEQANNKNHDTDILLSRSQWIAKIFPGRSWIGIELLHRLDDELWRDRLRDIAAETGLALVAAGDVLMHIRSRKPLQDTLTAIRLGRALTDCGMELQPNAEQHLRSRIRLANIYDASMLQQTLEIASRCTFHWASCGMNIRKKLHLRVKIYSAIYDA